MVCFHLQVLVHLLQCIGTNGLHSVLHRLGLRPVQRQPRQRKGTDQLLVQPLPSSTVFGFDPFGILDALQRLPPLDSHGSVFLSQLFSPPRIEPSPVLFTGQFSDHSLPPSLLQNQVLAFDFLSLLRWHGVIAPQSLLALALFEGLVFSRGLETGDSLVVSLAATDPHILYAVHSRILSGSIPPLAVLFLLNLRVHGSTRSIASSTRRPTHIIARMDFSSPLACPAAGQCALGFRGNTHD